MKMKRYILLSFAVLLAAACSKAPTPAGTITIDATVGVPTRVSYDGKATAFTSGDRIAVYAWTAGATEAAREMVVDGIVNTFGSDGSWTAATPMQWKNRTDAHFFAAVYPVPATAPADLAAMPFILDPADYTASDLMLATRLEGLKFSSDPVKLTFDHAMAKLNVNLKFRSQWTTMPAADAVAVTVTAKSAADVNVFKGGITATGDATSVPVPVAPAAASEGSGASVSMESYLSYSGLQIPQYDVRKITITVDGKDYVYKATSDIPLVGGQVTTVNLKVGSEQSAIQTELELDSITIADWESGASYTDGEAQER